MTLRDLTLQDADLPEMQAGGGHPGMADPLLLLMDPVPAPGVRLSDDKPPRGQGAYGQVCPRRDDSACS